MTRRVSQNLKPRTSCDTGEAWNASEMQFTVQATQQLREKLRAALKDAPRTFEPKARLPFGKSA